MNDEFGSNGAISLDHQETDEFFQQFNCDFQPISTYQKTSEEPKNFQFHIPKSTKIKQNINNNPNISINVKKGSKQFQQEISTPQKKQNQQLLKVLQLGREKSFQKGKHRFGQESEIFSFLPDESMQDIHDDKKASVMQNLQPKGDISQLRDELMTSLSQVNANNKSQDWFNNNVQVIQKRKRKGSSIFNKGIELGNLKITQKQLKQRRKQELIVTKEILTGKVSIIWIFLIDKLTEEQQRKIKNMYHGLSDKNYVVPLCKQCWQIRPFLQIPNSLFKIVSKLSDISNVLMLKDNPKIVEIYIHCNVQKEMSEALAYKSHSRKIKGIFFDLSKTIFRAEEQLQNQIKLFQSKKGLTKRKYIARFPSFMKLSGQDKSFATLYRANLYGAKNLLSQEKDQMLEEFINLVEEKYGNDEQQKENIIQYMEIIKEKQEDELERARKIIMSYVGQSFYYKILNSLLRTVKTTEEFRPCILPFNETYHSIKQFYTRQLSQTNRKIAKQTLYRGAKLKYKDFSSLKPDTYIEMFGFMSTSKNIERAKDFTDHLGSIFVIHVPQMVIPEGYDQYDHGFVDINLHNLASQKFSIQEEVLFNCLNIYKVRKIEQEQEDGLTLIHLQYGVIFDLLPRKKNSLSNDEKDVLLNYEFCINLFNKIEDQGDVYFLAHEYEKAIYYYERKIKENGENMGKFYYKLGKVQHQCGRLEQAEKNTRKSLELGLLESTKSQSSQGPNCIEIYSQNSSIYMDIQDFVEADESLDDAIELIHENSFIDKAKKIRERGQIKRKKGQITQAEDDFFLSENILRDINKTVEKRRSKIQTNYFFDLATVWCSNHTMTELEQEKEKKLSEMDILEQEIKDMEDQITQQLIKINDSLRDTAMLTQNKEKYELCVKKAQIYLQEIKKRQTNDPIQEAKIKVLEATVQDFLDLNQSSRLLSEAIKLVEECSDPFDEKVGQYSELLAHLQKQNLQKFSDPKHAIKAELNKGMQPIVYDEVKQKQVSEQCKKNYQKAINVLLYNNKSKSSPEVMSLKNQIGELQLNDSNYDSGFEILTQVKECRKGKGQQHSEVARSCLLISKISYARGQLKNSFENAQEANKTLKKALVKKSEERYIKIYETSDIFIQTKMHRAKIYLKQLKHDLSLKQLNTVEEKIRVKLGEKEYHHVISDIYEMRGQNMASLSVEDYLDDYFLKAIRLRERQVGVYNLANAITYCNYAKYLSLIGNIEEAGSLLSKAAQIFSCFSEDHPVTWLVFYCYGVYNQKQNNLKESLQLLKNCLQKAYRRYDRSHITVNKIRFQYARNLCKVGKFEEAVEEFQELQNDLQVGIQESRSRSKIVSEEDDEKIVLEQSLYGALQEAYKKMDNDENLKISQSGIARCKNKLNVLRKTYSKKSTQQQEF